MTLLKSLTTSYEHRSYMYVTAILTANNNKAL